VGKTAIDSLPADHNRSGRSGAADVIPRDARGEEPLSTAEDRQRLTGIEPVTSWTPNPI
jgi:hypothetical protein